MIKNSIRKLNKFKSKATRAAIYVPTASQIKSEYIKQVESCRKYIEQQGWIGQDLFVEKSRDRSSIRPIAQLMLQRAKTGHFDIVVIPYVFSEFTDLADKLVENKVKLHMIEPEENYIVDTTSMNEVGQKGILQ